MARDQRDDDDDEQRDVRRRRRSSSTTSSRDKSERKSSNNRHHRKTLTLADQSQSDYTNSSSDSEHKSGHRSKRKRHYKRYSDSESETGSESEYSGLEDSEEEEERRRRRRKRRKREEKERKRRKREKEDEKRRKRKKKEKREKEEKKKKMKKGKIIGAVTDSWGKFGVIKETDMWNKRPEFTAWLSEVKEVNLEALSNWEEKKMFKEYMEDFNTATFPSKKYYDLDAYHRNKLEKEMKKGFKKIVQKERTVFNDEEQRRQEMMQVREKQKEQEVETLKTAMQSGMAQAMKEQTRLKEEMQYLYKIGSFEAAAAIQKKLDPDVAM